MKIPDGWDPEQGCPECGRVLGFFDDVYACDQCGPTGVPLPTFEVNWDELVSVRAERNILRDSLQLLVNSAWSCGDYLNTTMMDHAINTALKVLDEISPQTP